MRFLIDTHTFLWFNEGSPALSHAAKALMENGDNELFISIASLWEISIKVATGKLQIQGAYKDILDDIIQNDIEILPINFAHTVTQLSLPFHHRDPFDRILIAQAMVEGIGIIGRDEIMDSYLTGASIQRFW